jgi:hypothetical protein
MVEVSHEAWIGFSDDDGKPLYDVPVALQAHVQEGTNQLRLATGEEISTKACVSFLTPVEANGAADRREPIDPRDRITIRPGTPTEVTGVIVDNPGAQLDPSTGAPYINSMWLR